MAKMQMQGKGNAFLTMEMLTDEIYNNGITCELIKEFCNSVNQVDKYGVLQAGQARH